MNAWDTRNMLLTLYGYKTNPLSSDMKSEIEPPKKNGDLSPTGGNHPVVIPDEIRLRLPRTPDHVEEARRECTYHFIADALLPRMQDPGELTVSELQQMARDYKTAFRETHPSDFLGEFELIPAAEMELLQLWVRCQTRQAYSEEWNEIASLVKRALTEMKPLLDENPDELYAV